MACLGWSERQTDLWETPTIQWSVTCPEAMTALLPEMDLCRLEEPVEAIQQRAALCCLGDKHGDLLELQSHFLCYTSNNLPHCQPSPRPAEQQVHL